MAIYRGSGGSGDAVNDSASEAVITVQARDAALAAQAAAEAARDAAQTAETNAETAETNAETAETNAETAQAAAASSASGASTSATNAAASASTATTQATNASNSASAASTSATNAASSASAASTSASNASSSASAASTSASNASTSASTASTQASNASTSATNASNSATSASTSASTATTQASNASTSATNAASSASAASTSATSASGSATTATTQAGIATTQASNASTSATNASNSASAASTSASNASTSETNAAASAASAAASFDAFDDIYLGAKASDPTVDNDGNTLTTGDQYFNTASNELRVWNGSSWQAASTVGGTVSSLTVTGVTTVSAGSVSAPAITTTGDTNTGIFFPAADTIAFTEGGAEAMRISSTGTVGIGTNDPIQRLQVSGNIGLNTGVAPGSNGFGTAIYASDFPRLTLRNSTTGDTVSDGFQMYMVGNDVTHNLLEAGYQAWFTSNTERMRLTSTGLGIGTTSPNAKLSVRTTGAQVDVSSSATSVTFEAIDRSATTNPVDTLYYTRNGTFQWYNSSYTERMRLDTSGNLGLGVTTSAWGTGTLQRAIEMNGGCVWSFGTSVIDIGANWYYNSSSQNIYKVSQFATDYRQRSDNGQHQWFTAPSGTAGNAITFTQAMTLDASGNLGIGTTAPAARLVSAGSSSTVYKALILRNADGTDGSSATIDFETSSGTQGSEAAMAGRVAGLRTGSGTSGALTFSTTNAGVLGERMRITNTGNVGIGTSSPLGKLQVGGGANATSAMSDGQLQIRTSSGTAYVVIGNGDGANTGVYMGGAASTTVFGTVTDAGTRTERMRIDSSGNVGIGATANASAILDAQSTTKGVRMPNMTTTQKNAIATPAAGLMVFDTTLAKLCVYTGSAWQTITSI